MGHVEKVLGEQMGVSGSSEYKSYDFSFRNLRDTCFMPLESVHFL
jgi:hypothetical protein